MSDGRKSHSSSASTLNSTRQLLDELDALMERMLALPVRDSEDSTPAASPDSDAEVEAAAAATQTLTPPLPSAPLDEEAAENAFSFAPAEELPSADEEVHEPPLPSWLQELRERSISSEAVAATITAEGPVPPHAAAAPAGEPVTAQKVSPPPAEAATPTQTVSPPVVETAAPIPRRPYTIGSEALRQPSQVLTDRSWHTRWWLWPLVVLNFPFEACTYLLGPLGRWLRSRWGRALAGWLGLALLLTALIWQIWLWVCWN